MYSYGSKQVPESQTADQITNQSVKPQMIQHYSLYCTIFENSLYNEENYGFSAELLVINYCTVHYVCLVYNEVG